MKWDDKLTTERAEHLASRGLNNKQICAKLNIHEDTFYTWMKEKPVFSDAIKRGRELSIANVVNALYEAAVGECKDATLYQEKGVSGEMETVKKTTRRLAPNLTACIFYLCNRSRDDWRNVNDVGNKPADPEEVEKKKAEDIREIIKATLGADYKAEDGENE